LRFANTRHTRHDTGWMNAPSTMRLWEAAAHMGLPVCIIFYVRHLSYNLPALSLIAEQFPDLPIIVEHLGLPHAPVAWVDHVTDGKPIPFPGPPDYGINAALRELRAHRNIYFKLTGINLEYLAARGVSASDLVRRFVSEFGVERLMCGSDIGQTPGPYGRIVADLRNALANLDERERAIVLFETAYRLFGRALAKA
jgi:predicted TIM-barrel fold metal-dependent hydrolase